ncbi:hypothetical protein AB2I16_26515 (plasmid) [Escherichia coli]
MNPIRFFSHSMLLMRMFVVLPGVFAVCCGRAVYRLQSVGAGDYLPC